MYYTTSYVIIYIISEVFTITESTVLYFNLKLIAEHYCNTISLELYLRAGNLKYLQKFK